MAKVAATVKPLAALAEGAGSRNVLTGAFPFSRRKSSTTVVRRPDFQRQALVTVAGLCRIHTGFADPTVLIFS
jgi:hypothetical protein